MHTKFYGRDWLYRLSFIIEEYLGVERGGAYYLSSPEKGGGGLLEGGDLFERGA